MGSQTLERQRDYSQDYQTLLQSACRNPFDRSLAEYFFRKHEEIRDHDRDSWIKYYQLKFLYTENRWVFLNKLAELFLEENKPSLAYMSLLQSLRLNPGQLEVFERVNSLKEHSTPLFPQGVTENTCTVSVIMATYNRLEVIKESIESFLAQTFTDAELIIINDGGPEQVKEIIDSFQCPRIRYFRFPENKGMSAAYNEGIRLAQGRYIAYLDDDDIFYPDHLETLVKVLDRGQYKLVYTNNHKVEGVMEGGRFQKLRTVHVKAQDFDRDILLLRTFVVTCAVMHTKDIFKEVGGYNEDLGMSEDWDLWLRCAFKYDFKHISRNTSEYRVRKNNVTERNKLAAAFFGRIVPKYYAFYQGKVAFTKFYLQKGAKTEARALFSEIREEYPNRAKSLELIEELTGLAEQFGDKKFFMRLTKDYFRFDAKRSIKRMIKERSLFMFLSLAPQLPYQAVKSIRGRAANLVKKGMKAVTTNVS